jgi:hypothetical protein
MYSMYNTSVSPGVVPQIVQYLYWTQNNYELRWPLQVDTWEGGEDRKKIAHREREPILSLYYTMLNI